MKKLLFALFILFITACSTDELESETVTTPIYPGWYLKDPHTNYVE